MTDSAPPMVNWHTSLRPPIQATPWRPSDASNRTDIKRDTAMAVPEIHSRKGEFPTGRRLQHQNHGYCPCQHAPSVSRSIPQSPIATSRSLAIGTGYSMIRATQGLYRASSDSNPPPVRSGAPIASSTSCGHSTLCAVLRAIQSPVPAISPIGMVMKNGT